MLRSVEAVAFRVVLFVVAWLMVVASRFSKRVRSQLTRDMLFEISSDDGARQHIEIHSGTRKITAPRNPAATVECALRFASGRDGITTLLSTDTAGRIVRAMNTGGTRIDGNPVLVLWLHGLTRVVLPIGRTHYPRSPVPAPVRGPETVASWASKVVREPAVTELDREWTRAWRAREKLLQLRAAEGEPLPPG